MHESELFLHGFLKTNIVNIFVPRHQIEIRFSNILDFPNVIKPIVSPFVNFASNVKISNEGSVKEVITLDFKNEGYQILALWDRLVLIYQGDTALLSESNSLIEDPFFQIFKLLKKSASFGGVRNFLVTSVYVLLNEKSFEANNEDFKKKYYSDFFSEIVKETIDTSVSGETFKDEVQMIYNFGPFKGVADLNQRNIEIQLEDYFQLFDKSGIIIEAKQFELTNNIDFNLYKKRLSDEIKIVEQLWSSFK